LVLNSGSGGSTLATDEVSINSTTVQVPRTKVGFGVDGSYDGEAAHTTPLPVNAYLSTAKIQNGSTQLTPVMASIVATTVGDNMIVAAGTGKIRVLALHIVLAVTGTARFEDGAGGTALTGAMDVAANGSVTLPFNPVGWFETTAATLLNLELTGASNEAMGCLTYVDVV